MILQLTRRYRGVLIACVIGVLGLPEIRVAHSSALANGSVGGTVKLVQGNQTFPVVGARLELMSVSDEGRKYQAMTDGTGKYAIDLPQGTYKILLAWMGGDCAEIHRASFRLDADALTFDFLVMQCPITDPIIRRVPIEEEAEKSVRPQGTNPMNVPVTEQTEKYQEQIIPAEQDHWPEIIVSFGKYDNHADEIRYFPLHQVVINRPTITAPPVPLSLPVTITVDRYTLRASDVFLDKKLMVFKATGDVSVSDGKSKHTVASATLAFSSEGHPKLSIEP